MSDMLRWPFRIVLYFILYIVWSIIALIILAIFPMMTYLEAINVLPAGWIPITAVFFADLYFTQLRGRNHEVNKSLPCNGPIWHFFQRNGYLVPCTMVHLASPGDHRQQVGLWQFDGVEFHEL